MKKITSQAKIEQQLSAQLYHFGVALSEQRIEGQDVNQLQSLHADIHESLQGLIRCERFSQIIDMFLLDIHAEKLLALAYIFSIEPDILTPYLKTTWYEQGPSLSLYRAVNLLSSIENGSMVSALRNSPLYQWQFLQAHNTVDAGIEKITLDHQIVQMLSGQAISVPNLLTLSATLNPAHAICFASQLTTYHGRFIQLVCDEKGERLPFVLSLAKSQGQQQCFVLDTRTPVNCSSLDQHSLRNSLRDAALATPHPFIYWPQGAAYCAYFPELISVLHDWQTLDVGTLIFDHPSAPIDSDLTEELNYPSTLSKFTTLHCPSLNTTQRAILWQNLFTPLNEQERLVDKKPLAGKKPLADKEPNTKLAIKDLNRTVSASTKILTASDAMWLAQLYPIAPSEIAKICQQELNSTIDANSNLILKNLQTACIKYYQTQHPDLATLVQPSTEWSDMVLTPVLQQQLNELIYRLHHRSILQDEIKSFRPGIQALLWGKPGTGKSMAAEAIAAELMLPLYKVNLANVASKWIGESEKHLAKLFDQAERQHAVLLFDEADAIFAKRSEVSSSQDKNANMGVSFLLQRMENYSGLLLLSTNFKNNLDDAFLRRLHSVIEFVMPDKSARHRLWQQAWSGKHQPNADINLEQLAEIFDFSPAQIANVAELSVLLCLAEQQQSINKDILARAILRELGKENAGYLATQKVSQWVNKENKGEQHGSISLT